MGLSADSGSMPVYRNGVAIGGVGIEGDGLYTLDKDPADDSHRFLVDIREVVLTKVGTPPDHLVIESWRPDTGLRRRQRT